LLEPADREVKILIEQEARRVAILTALSPSGRLDAALMLWRHGRLVLRIAELYGVRPGACGCVRLLGRVVLNMAAAEVSQELIDLLRAAYAPGAIKAATDGIKGGFEWVSRAGVSMAAIEPISGGLLALFGWAGKGAAGLAGTAAEMAAGPLLQGLLTAILTVRIGLAAQDECRLIGMSTEERRAMGAGTFSAVLGFLRSALGLGGSSKKGSRVRGRAERRRLAGNETADENGGVSRGGLGTLTRRALDHVGVGRRGGRDGCQSG
jgi:hypothetical protein